MDDLQAPYIDFHDNKYKMRRKSVYIRKYHILNVINDITQKNNIQIGNNNREKILRIFAPTKASVCSKRRCAPYYWYTETRPHNPCLDGSALAPC